MSREDFPAHVSGDGRRCVAVDVETTGLSAVRGGRVVEVGAVAFHDGGISGEFHSLINPAVLITSGARNVHGITDDMLAGKPKPEDVLPDFHRFIGSSALVAHNASFDVTFLRYEFGRLGLGFNNPYHCTLAMCRRRFPKLRDHKLETVYRHLFGALPDGTTVHRALDDARMVARVWMEMIKRPSRTWGRSVCQNQSRYVLTCGFLRSRCFAVVSIPAIPSEYMLCCMMGFYR